MKYILEHYAYYDPENGRIFRVNHNPPTNLECAIKIEPEIASKFLNGTLDINSYEVMFVQGELELSKKNELNFKYFFRYNCHYYIEENLDDADCVVIWDAKGWKFRLSSKAQQLLNEKLKVSKLAFFVTLKTDFDFLIRIMEVNTKDICENLDYIVSFISSYENDINKISISTYAVFESYGLKINYEN